MLRFKGFKATLNLITGNNKNLDSYDATPGDPICGAYRLSRDEFFFDRAILEPPKKTAPSPAMVKLPQSQKNIKPYKSTADLSSPQTEPQNLRTSTPNLAREAKTLNKNETKEQKKLEKQQREEQKKRKKQEAQEAKKQEKIKKESENQKQIDKNKSKPKRAASKPQVQPDPQSQVKQYSTNTLESSISTSSGPPPYSPPAQVNIAQDSTGNISFAKPTEEFNWNMISLHRQQINHQTILKDRPKQTHIDLNYAGISDSSEQKSNSDA